MIKNRSKKYIKCLLSAMLTLALLLTVCACGRVQMEFEIINDIYNLNGEEMQYDHGYEWTTGSTDSTGGQTEQGVNNFYYMYTYETNKSTLYDISHITECVYSAASKSWQANYNGKRVNVTGERQVSADGYNTCMGIDAKKVKLSSVIGFKAPQDGVYQFKAVNIDLGNTSPDSANSDGVRIHVYADRNEVYVNDAFTQKYQENYGFSLNVTLKKNQYMYFIVDPLQTADNDSVSGVYLQVNLETSYTQMHIDNNVAWGFGDLYYTGANAEQGADGWYYLYGDKNEYGVYKPETFKECKLDANSLTAQTSTFGIWLGDGAEIEQPDGIMTAGETTAAVLALEVPRKGCYAFDIYFDAEAIGNFSVYCGDRRVRVPSFEEGADGHMSFEAVMEENERFYFVLNEGDCEPKIAVRKIAKITGLEEAE